MSSREALLKAISELYDIELSSVGTTDREVSELALKLSSTYPQSGLTISEICRMVASATRATESSSASGVHCC